MRIGKQTQFFGVRVNHLKTLLYAINSGRDEMSGDQVRSMRRPIEGEVLSCDIVFEFLDTMMEPLAKTYVNALNINHYMHDKYSCEAGLMGCCRSAGIPLRHGNRTSARSSCSAPR